MNVIRTLLTNSIILLEFNFLVLNKMSVGGLNLMKRESFCFRMFKKETLWGSNIGILFIHPLVMVG